MAEKLPSGKYRHKLYIGKDKDGRKQYKSFTGDSPTKARKAAYAWQEEHIPDEGDPTLQQACDIFMAHRSSSLSPASDRTYRQKLNYLAARYPELFRSRLSRISSERIQEMINDLAAKKHDRTNRTISAKTVETYVSIVETVLKTNGVTLRGLKLPQQQKPELNIPEEETVKRLLDIVRGTSMEIPVLLAALGPMRRGEICALRMEDVDGNVVHVRRNMVMNADRKWVVKIPKTSAGHRDIEYPAYVTDLIREKGKIISCNPDTLSHDFSRLLSRHGLDHFRFHDLRHYAASFLLALNIPAIYVMERGGWETEGTMKRYIHALDKQKSEYSAKANSAFENLFVSHEVSHDALQTQ